MAVNVLMLFLYLTGHVSRNIFVYEEHRFPLLLVCAALFLGVLDWRFLGVSKRETRSQTCKGQGNHSTELPRFLSDVFYKTFSSFKRMLAHVTVFKENCTISTRFVTLPEQS